MFTYFVYGFHVLLIEATHSLTADAISAQLLQTPNIRVDRQ